eukprot:2777198-Alexandrium_andersonii.AAC.1
MVAALDGPGSGLVFRKFRPTSAIPRLGFPHANSKVDRRLTYSTKRITAQRAVCSGFEQFPA